MGEPVGSGVELTTDERGFVGAAGCPLSEPGPACLAPCEAQMQRWLEYGRWGR